MGIVNGKWCKFVIGTRDTSVASLFTQLTPLTDDPDPASFPAVSINQLRNQYPGRQFPDSSSSGKHVERYDVVTEVVPFLRQVTPSSRDAFPQSAPVSSVDVSVTSMEQLIQSVRICFLFICFITDLLIFII
jgi:hypothetical protein